MITLDIQYEDGLRQCSRHALPLTVGRSTDCGKRVAHWRMAKHHFNVTRGVDGLYIEDLGSLGGTRVNGSRITRYGPLKPADGCIAGPCLIYISDAAQDISVGATNSTRPMSIGEEHSPVQTFTPDKLTPERPTPESHSATLYNADSGISPYFDDSYAPQHKLFNQDLGQLYDPGRLQGRGQSQERAHPQGHVHPQEQVRTQDPLHPQGRTHTQEQEHPQGQAHTQEQAPPQEEDMFFSGRDNQELRQSLHAALIQAFDLRRHDVSVLSDQALRHEAVTTVTRILSTYPEACREQDNLIRLVVDEAVGLGVLEKLLDDPAVSEIMVNRYDDIYVERRGKLIREQTGFSSEAAVRAVIDRIVFPLGRRIDESSPMVDARLTDGSRMNAVIPPIALRGACMTIRKFPKSRLKLADLVASQSMSLVMAELLTLCVRLRLNILVSGGTGSGKTTLLNILGECIPAGQRLVTIEDSAELQIHHPHVISLESRPENSEGHGQVSIRQLVRNAMRMRPDRIVVGEVRGVEAFDMLVAMNTGHEGSLTTLHANSTRDALARLETMVLTASVGLPLQAIREQISSAIQIIIQQSRLPCGRRLITRIAEISGIESGTIQMQTLVHFDPMSQQFIQSALPPAFFESHACHGEPFVQSWFARV